jgi:hypothetical protein
MANIWQTGMRKEGSFWEGVNPPVHSFDDHTCRSVFCCTWMDDNPVIIIPSPESPFNYDMVAVGYSGDWSEGYIVVRYAIQNNGTEGDINISPKYGQLEPITAPAPEWNEEEEIWQPTTVFVDDKVYSTDSYVKPEPGIAEYVQTWTITWVGGKGLSATEDFTISIPDDPNSPPPGP